MLTIRMNVADLLQNKHADGHTCPSARSKIDTKLLQIPLPGRQIQETLTTVSFGYELLYH